MAAFVKFEVPKDVAEKTFDVVEKARDTGKVRIGVNEATKAIERGIAKLVVMAEDTTPEEVLMHIPVLCEERKVPYSYVASKAELGKASGIEVPTSSIAVTETGDGKKMLEELSKKLDSLKK